MTKYGCACQIAPFSAPLRYMMSTPFLKKKVYEWPDFLELEWPKLSDTHVYAHIFRSDTRQAFVFTFT